MGDRRRLRRRERRRRHRGPPCEATRCLDVRLHVVTGAATPAWITEQLTFAKEKFAPLDVGFRVVQVETLPAPDHVHTRADRDAIATGRLDANRIDVFLPAKVDNIDVAGERIYGVTWRSGAGRHVILSAKAQPRTLTHELGHLSGCPTRPGEPHDEGAADAAR